jgi:hypothetical protein
MSQIIDNCVLSKIDIESLPIFDLEYIFLKLRSKSVNNLVQLRYRDNEDQKTYEFIMNLDELSVTIDPDNNKTIAFTDNMGIVMKYPNFKMMLKFSSFNENDPDEILEVIASCIDLIYDGDTVYKVSEHSKEELNDFMSSLSSKQMEKVYKFLDTLPKIEHTINYINSLGNDRVIKLEGISDFFQ